MPFMPKNSCGSTNCLSSVKGFLGGSSYLNRGYKLYICIDFKASLRSKFVIIGLYK